MVHKPLWPVQPQRHTRKTIAGLSDVLLEYVHRWPNNWPAEVRGRPHRPLVQHRDKPAHNRVDSHNSGTGYCPVFLSRTVPADVPGSDSKNYPGYVYSVGGGHECTSHERKTSCNPPLHNPHLPGNFHPPGNFPRRMRRSAKREPAPSCCNQPTRPSEVERSDA